MQHEAKHCYQFLLLIAWQYNSLSGQYRIAGQTNIDPPPSKAKGTHSHLELSGTDARDLYNAMKVALKSDECVSNGALIKFLEETQCRLKRAQKRHQEIV
ncbi:MAG: hypothetical protein DU480_02775 [Nitrosomonas sp.]